jgi:hypothetical protein
MKKSIQIQVLMTILAAGMMFSSCGNVDIVKRKYRPGFHVDVSKKRQKTKTAEQSSVADNRKTKKFKTIESKKVNPVATITDNSLTATTKTVEPVQTKNAKSKRGSLMSLPDFKNLSFDRKMKTIKNEIFKPKPRGNTSWMKWVAFGAGLASMIFGFMALLFAFLFASSYFIWPAMILSGAAIVFGILYRNGNGTDPKARLGMIFGIVGGGLALIALIIWAIWIGLELSAVL